LFHGKLLLDAEQSASFWGQYLNVAQDILREFSVQEAVAMQNKLAQESSSSAHEPSWQLDWAR
jgi:hypothetical protein